MPAALFFPFSAFSRSINIFATFRYVAASKEYLLRAKAEKKPTASNQRGANEIDTDRDGAIDVFDFPTKCDRQHSSRDMETKESEREKNSQ